MLEVHGDRVVPGGDVWPPGVDGAGRGSADRWRLRGQGVGKKAGGGGVIPGGSRCPARLPNVLASSLKYLIFARWLVVWSLFVIGQSSAR